MCLQATQYHVQIALSSCVMASFAGPAHWGSATEVQSLKSQKLLLVLDNQVEIRTGFMLYCSTWTVPVRMSMPDSF